MEFRSVFLNIKDFSPKNTQDRIYIPLAKGKYDSEEYSFYIELIKKNGKPSEVCYVFTDKVEYYHFKGETLEKWDGYVIKICAPYEDLKITVNDLSNIVKFLDRTFGKSSSKH